jgi:hypothetical protein
VTAHRPAFSGARLTLLDWQITALEQMLGRQLESFDLPGWLCDLDAALDRSGYVMPPRREQHRWLEELLFAECKRRALPMAVPPQLGKLTTRMASALSEIMGARK